MYFNRNQLLMRKGQFVTIIGEARDSDSAGMISIMLNEKGMVKGCARKKRIIVLRTGGQHWDEHPFVMADAVSAANLENEIEMLNLG